MIVNKNDYDKLNNVIAELEARALAREKEKSLLSREVPQGYNIKDLILVRDTREQLGSRYSFNGLKVADRKLEAGDYSISPYEFLCTVERKSKDDFVSTLIHNRDRFIEELNRMQSYENKCVVVEASYQEIVNGFFTSRANPNSVEGLSHSITYNHNTPVFYLDNFQLSERFTQLYLIAFYKKKERQQKSNFVDLSIGDLEAAQLLTIEQSVISLTLAAFIDLVTLRKDCFRSELDKIKPFKSKAILLSCSYADVIAKNYRQDIKVELLEDIIISIIINHNIPIIFTNTPCISDRFKQKHLQRYLPPLIKPKLPRKKRNAQLK